MRGSFFPLVAAATLSTALLLAQAPLGRVAAGSPTTEAGVLAGQWTYRSFHNNPTPVDGDPNRALLLIFAEAVFTFETPSGNMLKGAIDWPGGGLDLSGTIDVDPAGGPPTMRIVGAGRAGTGTDGWQYDYHARLAHQWANGVDQVPALVGSVIRTKPHGGSPAGYVASFIAVKRR